MLRPRKRGRPRGHIPLQKISMNLPVPLFESAMHFALARNSSLTAVTRRALAEYLVSHGVTGDKLAVG